MPGFHTHAFRADAIPQWTLRKSPTPGEWSIGVQMGVLRLELTQLSLLDIEALYGLLRDQLGEHFDQLAADPPPVEDNPWPPPGYGRH